jgi:hypothetical protein
VSRPRDIFHADRGWIKNSNGSCPVNPDSLVRFQFCCGKLSERTYPAGSFNWKRRGWDFDVQACQFAGAE